MCAVTGLLAGLAPAASGSLTDPNEMLKRGGRTASGRGRRLHGVLIIGELALAMVLMAGAGLMLKSLWLMNATAAQYAPEQVLSTRMEEATQTFSSASDARRYIDDTQPP